MENDVSEIKNPVFQVFSWTLVEQRKCEWLRCWTNQLNPVARKLNTSLGTLDLKSSTERYYFKKVNEMCQEMYTCFKAVKDVLAVIISCETSKRSVSFRFGFIIIVRFYTPFVRSTFLFTRWFVCLICAMGIFCCFSFIVLFQSNKFLIPILFGTCLCG